MSNLRDLARTAAVDIYADADRIQEYIWQNRNEALNYTMISRLQTMAKTLKYRLDDLDKHIQRLKDITP